VDGFILTHTTTLNTPDVMGYYPSEAYGTAPYMTGILNRVIKCLNYNNFEDWALRQWEKNNAYKPDSLYGFGYRGSLDAISYLDGGGRFYRSFHQGQRHLRQILTLYPDEIQRYQIFAYCAESRSKALGQTTGEVTGFTSWDLKTNMGYNNKHYSHSREFRSNVGMEAPFWEKVRKDCGFETTLQ
jgi:hypothetical protein